MSTTLQKPVPDVAATSTTVPPKVLNAEEVTTMTTDSRALLKRIGHKSKLKPKRVSLEEEVCTVEIETKKLMAVVKVGTQTREIKEHDVQSKSEESSFAVNPKFIVSLVIL